MAESIFLDEIVDSTFSVAREFTKEQPNDSHEIADVENGNGQFECLETITYFHEQLNIIVVDVLILSKHWVLFDHFLESTKRYFLDFMHEKLDIKNVIHLSHPDNLDEEQCIPLMVVGRAHVNKPMKRYYSQEVIKKLII